MNIPKKKIVGIIQARMASSRLPGKMIKNLGDYPLLRWVFERVRLSRLLDELILATTDAPEDDSLVTLAKQCDVSVYRGDCQDVLARFVGAAHQTHADIVVRICADNPFVAPEEIDRVVTAFLENRPDYAFNHIPKMKNGYPDGLGAEVLESRLLEKIERKALLPHYREHVTSYIWEHLDEFRIFAVPCPPSLQGYPQMKLDVDTEEDLHRARKICENISFHASAAEIMQASERIHD